MTRPLHPVAVALLVASLAHGFAGSALADEVRPRRGLQRFGGDRMGNPDRVPVVDGPQDRRDRRRHRREERREDQREVRREERREDRRDRDVRRQTAIESRQERRREARFRAYRRWRGRHFGPDYRPGAVSAPLRTELGVHARRIARLRRVRELAVDRDDRETVERVDTLLKKEEERHLRTMEALAAPPEGT